MSIDAKVLDGVKLVYNEEYYATDRELEQELEALFQQASQGWGIRRESRAMLTMARELRDARAIAETADENRRMLKGSQLGCGRLKKQIETLQAHNQAQAKQITALCKDNAELDSDE